MKLLFDQNISHRILKFIPEQFANSTTIKNEGLINASDNDIWKFAKTNHYTIVTQDSDFNDLNTLYGFPPKIVWIRTGNIRTKSIVDILVHSFKELNKFIEDDAFGCFEIYNIKK